jgi:3-hexulose-6-phosphate synthase
MKLQVSFDLSDLDKALEVASAIAPYADIFEIGTLLMYKYGLGAVEGFMKAFPEKSLLIDTKIVDRGKETVNLFAHKNVSWITLMAGTHKDNILTTCTAAQGAKMKVMLDLLDSNAAGQSAMEAKTMGVHALLVHRTTNEKESGNFMEKWEMIRGNTDLPIFMAGKINRESLPEILALQPDGIVVGSAIIKADNPAQEAEFFHNELHK